MKMKKLKNIIVGVMALGMLSTMSMGIFADELNNVSNETSNSLACALQDYKSLVEKLNDAESNIDDIKDRLENQEKGSQEFQDIKEVLENAIKDLEELKKEIENAKNNIEREKENQNHGCQIGDSDHKTSNDTIGDSNSSITIGDSDYVKPNHIYKDFINDSWNGFISSDFIFTNDKKFKDKENDILKNEILALMEKYSDTETYIADETEDWWLKNKYQLTVKFDNGENSYSVKFNPIMEDDTLTSCYMYILSEQDDTIIDGYFITAEEYTTLKSYLSDAFLNDNVVAKVNNITDFDDFMELIESEYKKPTDYFFDVDGDTTVNNIDLLKLRRHILHLSVENDEINNYDCNGDSRVNTLDILQVKKKLLHLIEE